MSFEVDANGPTHATETVLHADRHDAVKKVLLERPMWSDRRIAQECNVSPKLVGRLRSCLKLGTPDTKRLGRDGRLRPTQPGADRTRIAAAVRARPEASLRSIASEVGVSPETVRSVKRSMMSGTESGEASNASDARAPKNVPAPLFRLASSRMTPPSWCADTAFQSTESGVSFLEWLDRTGVHGDQAERALSVPISRTYEIADEARRRAQWWRVLAETLESSVRRRAI